jgi:protein-S-isoprenylcysteine O-methyltransferase Ste14
LDFERKVFIRLVADAGLVAIILFISAGTLAWWRAWVMVVVLLVVRTVGAAIAYQVNPTLLRDRARLPLHPDQSFADRLLLLSVLATGFLGLPAIAALDRFQWHLFRRPTDTLGAAGLVLFTVGWGIKTLALRENAFATAVARLQPERNHLVVETGPYALVRHPFYAADPLIFLGQSLWLQSYAATLFALVPIALMVARLLLEERLLLNALPGYRAYAERVKHRLVPGLW